MITHEDVDARFAFHPPASERRRAEHARVRELLRAAAHELIDLVPPGRDQELMIDHLEDAMFRGNRGLALAPDHPTGEAAEDLGGLRPNPVAVEGDTRTGGVLAPAPAVGEGES